MHACRSTLEDPTRLLVELSLDSEQDVNDWMEKAFPLIAPVMAVERVAFWRFTPDTQTLRCEKRFNLQSRRWDDGLVMREVQARTYFALVHETPLMVIDDLSAHVCNQDLAPELRVLAPKAMIDVPILLGADRLGVLRFSAPAAARRWTSDEQAFATSLGHLLSLRFAETRRRTTEQKLRVADRMASLGTLAAGVAHEINNPLGFILGNLEFLKGEAPDGAQSEEAAEMQDAIGDAITGARRIRDIVSDLKALSRDSEEVGLKPIALGNVVSLSMRMAQSALRHRATVTLSVPEGLLLLGNDSKLGQVFLNLVVNAAQAMPERAAERNQIRLSARREGRKIEITVSDNGSGMTDEVRAKIFDPFFTTKPVGVGTGLGLSIVHGLVTQMNGTIAVTSKLGVGTTFVLTFPALLDERAEAEQPAKVRADPAVRRRILVVDDEAMSGVAIRRVLSEHQVEAVTDAQEALRRFEAGTQYDVVLCDLMMPMMTGMDLHAAVEEKFPAIKERMIFITGGAVTEHARRFVDRKDVRKLNKPFDVDSLRAVVSSTLAS